MSLSTVLSISVLPSKLRTFQDQIRRIAERAREKHDEFRWTAHEVVSGNPSMIHFVSELPDFTALAKRDITSAALVVRLFGEKEGTRLLDEIGACEAGVRAVIARDRPDLSYPPEQRDAPLAVVTVLRVRPGYQDAAEELIRKLAEAIPKVDDPARLLTYQTVIGDLRTLWTVRPIASLAELDRQLQPIELLNKAYGPAEGGLIGRGGMEALESVERSITMVRPDLSNPS
jgi:hypothetical protein